MAVPAAHTPMSGTFSFVVIGKMASATGVSMPVTMAATFS